MENLFIATAPKIALTAAGLFFMAGLLTGLWKYLCIRRSPKAEAPHYVNVAHRAALMYAFAAQLLAVFASLSVFPQVVNIAATILPLAFFALAIIHYVTLGRTTASTNSIRDAADKSKDYFILNLLSAAEIGGFAILLAGGLLRLWFVPA